MRKLMDILTGRYFLALVVVGGSALATAGIAGAAVTVPAIPVSDYGDSLLSALATAVSDVFPYAAAITAFAIGVGLVRRWLGHKRATRI